MNYSKNRNITITVLLFLFSVLGGQESDSASVKDDSQPHLITIHAEDAYLPSILAILAKESGYNIVTDPMVHAQDKISIHLDGVPVEEAINLVVRAVGLGYEKIGNSFLIADPRKLAKEVGITPHVLELKYADATEVKQLLSDLSDQIKVDLSGNKLLINTSPRRIAEIKNVIKKIDVPAIQVLLEVRLIEVAMDVDEKLGIDWSKLAKYTSILGENAEEIIEGAGSIVPAPGTLGALPTTALFNRLNGDNIIATKFSRQMTAFDVTLNFLLKNNKADILADSKLVTLNGREATIKMVDIVPYILSSGGVGGQVQVQREEVGIKLTVLPSVNTDGDITVKVEPEVASIFEFIGPDKNIPRVKSRSSSTTVRVKDGESIIIGGLISKDRKNTVYKFPFLHRIPWLGKKLFTYTDLVERKTDLIIQITPSVLKDNISGIPKNEAMIRLERSIMLREDEK